MAEKYTAILIDTSVYEQYGLRMEKGLLGKLTQFSRVETKLLLPDVIYSEVRKHLDVKIKASKVSLEKALDEASDHLFFEGSELNCARKSLIEGKEIEGLGKSRIDKFAKATAALMLETGEYVSVPELLRSYFTSKPPFAETGKKKSEFPDAIILMAVQSWAEQNQENVLAVARDEDWARFCEHSKFIHYETDLAKALAYFNEETAPYALTDNLERALNEGVAQKFIDDIAEELNSALSNFAPYQEANSYLYWEPGGSSGGFKHFEFSDNRFSVIDKDENRVVLEAYADITVYIDGDFSLSVYDSIDKDHVFMGSVTKRVVETFTSAILITISGELTGPIENLIVEEVEVIEKPDLIDFGELEMEYQPDYD